MYQIAIFSRAFLKKVEQVLMKVLHTDSIVLLGNTHVENAGERHDWMKRILNIPLASQEKCARGLERKQCRF